MLRVLIVDDESDILFLISQILSRAGVAVIALRSPLEALTLLQRDATFDALFTDILMPHMDGMRLLERVKRDYPHIKVALVSAHLSAAARTRAEALGADAMLAKPFHRQELLNLLTHVTA
jgi:two-component system, OmpR family, alkaline phosphatase synthesis response regulator PhoP